MDVFHSGERKVQGKLGVTEVANLVGQMIQPYMDINFQLFIESQPMVIVGSTDVNGCLWTSILFGNPGFMVVKNNRTIEIHTNSDTSDILYANLKVNSNIGMVIIDFSRRVRIRVNGIATILDNQTITITTEQVYGNCPKYIQSRLLTINDVTNNAKSKEIFHTTHINNFQKRWVEKADTFFISSSNAEGKSDASHRGGEVGFIHVLDDNTLQFPDYVGNRMFNTLGNTIENPKTGLLFLDFEKGHTLQLSGIMDIIWDVSEEDKANYPGALRLLKYRILQVIETRNAHNCFWKLLSYSPYNPKQNNER